MHQVLEQITINTGSDIRLQFPPVYIHVEIPNADPHKFIGKSLVPNKVVIPIRPKTKSEERKVYFPLREEPVVLKIRPHAVEFAFGIPVHTRCKAKLAKESFWISRAVLFHHKSTTTVFMLPCRGLNKANTFAFYHFSLFKLI